MPYTTFSDGSVLTASQVNTNFRDQVVSTVTSGTRPSGTEGQMIFETDTDRFYVYSGSGWVEWGGIGAWVSYTPTLVQSAAVAKTVTYAKYTKIGRMVTVQVQVSATGAGSANAGITLSLPFTAAATTLIIGSGMFYDNGGANYPGVVYLVTTTTMALIDATAATTGVFMGQTGSAFAAAIAAGDLVNMTAVYESTT